MELPLFEDLERKYALCASWAIWNGDDPRDPSVIRRDLGSLKSSVVMVALNVSGTIGGSWQNFHSRDHARKLIYAFNHSPYRGAYMTDLVKGEIDPNSASLSRRLRSRDIDVNEHVRSFRREMDDVGAKDESLFILFGHRAARLFGHHLGAEYPNYVYCPHYSMYGKGYTDAGWVAKTWHILEEHYRATATRFATPEFRVTDEMTNELEKLEKRKPPAHEIG